MAAIVERYTDRQVITGKIKVPGDGIEMDAILARPAEHGPHPAVVVVHENSGIDPTLPQAGPHYEDVTRRFARLGYYAVAPNFRQRGGTTRDMPEGQATGDMIALFGWLQEQPRVQADRIGCVGFCWGGGAAVDAAVALPELAASVIYYGRNPQPINDVARIRCPVIGFYGGNDLRISQHVPALVDAMRQHSKRFEPKIYEGAEHAFFNDTRPDSHHAEAARDSWERMIAFFEETLRAQT
ncbi:MAG: dlhH [Chloroflexi bacterium]|nr:dlhH [Chloroflexota bacterium]